MNIKFADGVWESKQPQKMLNSITSFVVFFVVATDQTADYKKI